MERGGLQDNSAFHLAALQTLHPWPSRVLIVTNNGCRGSLQQVHMYIMCNTQHVCVWVVVHAHHAPTQHVTRHHNTKAQTHKHK
jgi:hypothetical protein